MHGIGLPTLKRWAILGSPFGTQKAPHDFNCFRYAGFGITEVIPHPVLCRMVYDSARFDWGDPFAAAA